MAVHLAVAFVSGSRMSSSRIRIISWVSIRAPSGFQGHFQVVLRQGAFFFRGEPAGGLRGLDFSVRLHEFADLFADAAARNEGLSTFRAALAQMYCELDRPEDARRALASGADSEFANVPHDNLWLTMMAAYADACAQLGEIGPAGLLYPQIEPYSDRLVTNGVNANGSMARLLGLLAATLGRFDDADRHFAAACATHERIGAPIFLARARYEWAKALLVAGRDGDALRAR